MALDLKAARNLARNLHLSEVFDPSVLGYTKSELDDMDDEERADTLRDCLNRAADLAQAIQSAFKADLKDLDGGAVGRAASELIWTAKRVK